MMGKNKIVDILLRRIPYPGIVLNALGWFLFIKSPAYQYEALRFFVTGLGACCILTGIICVYLHAIWYRLYRAGRTDRS